MHSVSKVSVFMLLMCGVCAQSRPGRIVNGIDTTTSEHLHQVSVGYGTSTDWRHFCGASVIDEYWILTASHCVIGETPDKVNVIIHRDVENQVYGLEQIVMHPSYIDGEDRQGFLPYDIALLKTSEAIEDAVTYIINLPDDNDDQFISENCTITGWGYIKYEDGYGTDATKLQETWGEILDDAGCSKYYGAGYNHTHNLCIHNLNAAACMGDSGGPMVCKNVLAGVTSYGHNQCDYHDPEVYTRVSNFLVWINETMSAY